MNLASSPSPQTLTNPPLKGTRSLPLYLLNDLLFILFLVANDPGI
jgi:hypothetical protein